jgi:hypothetical protein
MLRGNLFDEEEGFDSEPDTFCQAKYDEELGDMSDEHCYDITEFSGSWF